MCEILKKSQHLKIFYVIHLNLFETVFLMKHRAIVWFRSDLRLHDNEALIEAIDTKAEIIPVFVFDERIFSGTIKEGFEKISAFRTKFIIEAVQDLRNSLKNLNADLVVRVGKPEEVIFELAKEFKTSWVYCNRERTDEELKVQDLLEKKLWTIGQEIRYARGKMLYYTADLPFPITQTPDNFTQFRKEVEKITPIRDPLPQPESISFITQNIERGDVPTLSSFGKKWKFLGHIENKNFIGGESHGIAQLNYYFSESKLLKTYLDTRNELLGWDFSSKFSAWLSAGCLSPKYIYQKIQEFEKEFGSNQSTYWLYFELLWRDYFRLIGKKYGNVIFKQEGILNKKLFYNNDFGTFEKWTKGKTGVPFIDANMRQLNQTGFMSNRGRQNVASYLVKDLRINWLLGAAYFESKLIDYDPCSNYCNWMYIAGVGNDPREDRHFNIASQAKKYDADGKFMYYWLPELKDTPIAQIHQMNVLESIEHV